MKVLVCGSRDWANKAAIVRELKKLPVGTTIIHGACPTGADALVDKVARVMGFPVRAYPADWEGEKERTGSEKAAGPKRNAQMIREEHVQGDPIAFVLAFSPDLARSRGTKDCTDRARRAGIRVEVHAA